MRPRLTSFQYNCKKIPRSRRKGNLWSCCLSYYTITLKSLLNQMAFPLKETKIIEYPLYLDHLLQIFDPTGILKSRKVRLNGW